jgi:hypothetical protein
MPWHSREFVVKDCEGRLLAFGANLRAYAFIKIRVDRATEGEALLIAPFRSRARISLLSRQRMRPHSCIPNVLHFLIVGIECSGP